MRDYNGIKWGSLTIGEQKTMMENANAVDGITGNNMTIDGECIIDLKFPYSVSGKIQDGEIIIDNEAVIYNPTM